MSAPPVNPYYQPPQQEGYQGLSKPPPYNTQPPPYPSSYPVPPPSYPPSQPGYPVPQPGYPGYPGAQTGYPQQQPYPSPGYPPYQQGGPYPGQPPNSTIIVQQPPQQVYVHEHKKADTTAEDCALGALCMACLCCCLMSD